jgi:hypothetical protein
MRAVIVMGLVALLWPVAAGAQGAPATPARGKDITKDEYVERAKQRAAKRFEKADTNHDGVLSAEERRAARGKRKTAAPQ